MARPGPATLSARASFGGALMGLANLVPGISGGTMLLATGIYQGFIEAVAEITTLRFRARSILLLAVVGATAAAVILLLAGPVHQLVTQHRWIMFSLFVGLTLGGVPIVWRMARPPRRAFWAGTAAGLAAMAVMAFTHFANHGEANAALLVIAGVAGAAAMILPGVSGAYMLIVLGQYKAILLALKALKEGRFGEAQPVLVPAVVGGVIGMVGVSNLVRWTLRRHEQATLGVLMGLILGSVLGMYPFQTGEVGRRRVFHAPSVGEAAAAVGLVVVGYLVTRLIDRIGKS